MQVQNEAQLLILETSDLEKELQDTLGALKEIERWYDWEHTLIQSHPTLVRQRMEADLEERRRQNREPYVQHLAQVYQVLNSRRMFEGSNLLSTGVQANLSRHRERPRHYH
ncbi:hypothetical protein [Microvirga splendida]|uniref:Flagellar protein FliT n=1 Tax=Microvirga splendida TaxID=2795727 RepID=A0ABS0Y3X6_9HYPH|nr:hypothetical protein [Microvirga splendida]MBJ6127015.1 hypothetical protein [Microvirga splendida]